MKTPQTRSSVDLSAAFPGSTDAKAGPPRQAAFVLRLLERLDHGQIDLVLPDGTRRVFGRGSPRAAIRLENWNVFAAALRDGDIGFAETFIAGDWHTEALHDVLDVLVANRTAIEQAVYGTWWGRLAHRVRHLLNRNSRAGARRNIQAHYDLGNDFYRLWLDPSMTYSSALFAGDATRTLEQAQGAKYQRILDVLALPQGSRVLEIGCGWGGFAEMASRSGLGLKGLTLSREQLDFAQRRLHAAGLDANTQFALQDYRDETDRYDAVVSIEMFEAVGEAYWPTYFASVARALKPGGRAVIQTITIDEALFERYRRGTDFIQQYVFPGGMLPSPSAFAAGAQAAGLQVREAYRFGTDYARTLGTWRERFLARLPEVRALGFDERFIRTWTFYLAYCESAFAHGNCDVVQYTLERV
jgi:cyclopropane-fatty-acyl-phospholipid synthase